MIFRKRFEKDSKMNEQEYITELSNYIPRVYEIFDTLDQVENSANVNELLNEICQASPELVVLGIEAGARSITETTEQLIRHVIRRSIDQNNDELLTELLTELCQYSLTKDNGSILQNIVNCMANLQTDYSSIVIEIAAKNNIHPRGTIDSIFLDLLLRSCHHAMNVPNNLHQMVSLNAYRPMTYRQLITEIYKYFDQCGNSVFRLISAGSQKELIDSVELIVNGVINRKNKPKTYQLAELVELVDEPILFDLYHELIILFLLEIGYLYRCGLSVKKITNVIDRKCKLELSAQNRIILQELFDKMNLFVHQRVPSKIGQFFNDIVKVFGDRRSIMNALIDRAW